MSMKRSIKAGFTIVELMVVIAILGILTGIISMAATSAIRSGREKRCSAMKVALQAGLASYYQRNGEWPGNFEDLQMQGQGETDLVVDNAKVNTAFRKLVEDSVKSSKAPYLDVTGLFVATEAVAELGDQAHASKNKKGGYGHDFRDVYGSNIKSSSGLDDIGKMVFGYQDRETGMFRRFKVRYNLRTDSVKVLTMKENDNQ